MQSSHLSRGFGRQRPVNPVQGSTIPTPVPSKSRTLRVTSVSPWTSAVAAIQASRSLTGSGTCNAAQVTATAPSPHAAHPNPSLTSHPRQASKIGFGTVFSPLE